MLIQCYMRLFRIKADFILILLLDYRCSQSCWCTCAFIPLCITILQCWNPFVYSLYKVEAREKTVFNKRTLAIESDVLSVPLPPSFFMFQSLSLSLSLSSISAIVTLLWEFKCRHFSHFHSSVVTGERHVITAWKTPNWGCLNKCQRAAHTGLDSKERLDLVQSTGSE